METVSLKNALALRALRALAEAWFAFMRVSDRQIRSYGLTTPQFDVIAVLGNTRGFTCKELSDRTLVTKGTLTGVLDRLESIDLIERVRSRTDRRSIVVRLTAKGEATFRRTFPRQVEYIAPYFYRALKKRELVSLCRLVNRLERSFKAPAGRRPPRPATLAE